MYFESGLKELLLAQCFRVIPGSGLCDHVMLEIKPDFLICQHTSPNCHLSDSAIISS